MRIISGKYKSIYIPNNKNIKARPTTSTAKEALFNILENRVLISELDVLDLFQELEVLPLNLFQEELKVLYALTNKLTR